MEGLHSSRLRKSTARKHNAISAEESYALYQRGSYREAVAAARQALAEKPDDADAWNNLGAAYNQLGQYPEAAAAFEAALRWRPDFGLARRNLRYSQDMMKRGSTNPP